MILWDLPSTFGYQQLVSPVDPTRAFSGERFRVERRVSMGI